MVPVSGSKRQLTLLTFEVSLTPLVAFFGVIPSLAFRPLIFSARAVMAAAAARVFFAVAPPVLEGVLMSSAIGALVKS